MGRYPKVLLPVPNFKKSGATQRAPEGPKNAVPCIPGVLSNHDRYWSAGTNIYQLQYNLRCTVSRRCAVSAIQDTTSRTSTPPTRKSAHVVLEGWAVELELRGPIRQLGGSDLARPRGHSLCQRNHHSALGRAAPRLDARAIGECHASPMGP